ncbi:MAG: hypothetical protein WCK46_01860 [Candidatus Adlerbacteria bacterium]
MRYRYVGALISTLFIFALPFVVQAACSANGYSIIFINGIFHTEQEAQSDKNTLAYILPKQINGEPLTVELGYNATHLEGVGDLAQSAFQLLNFSITDYDLRSILRQMYTEVKTRKLLLVGHSQGTLYANSLYSYLTLHGEPREALGVYNVATPASYTAGGGLYLTSKNDVLVTLVAQLAQKLHVSVPLSPNIDIAILPGNTTEFFPGHSFNGAYVAGAKDRIIADISGELRTLIPAFSLDTGDCFAPPDISTGDKVQKVLFAVADPTAAVIRTGVVATYQSVVFVVSTSAGMAQAGYAAADSVFTSVASLLSGPAVNPTAPENAEKNFAVVKKLYGSSVDTNSYRDLNKTQGGAALMALEPESAQTPASSTPEAISSSTSSPVMPVQTSATTTSATTTPFIATSTPVFGGSALPSTTDLASVASSTQDATTSPPAPPTPPTPISSIADTFDSFNLLGWQTFGSNVRNFEFDDGSDGECFHGGCVVGFLSTTSTDLLIPRMYVELPPALDAGAFTVYAKARSGFNSPDTQISLCAGVALGCTDAERINFLNHAAVDNVWHQYYFAWRQGASFVQSCVLEDDSNAADCAWVDTGFTAGTQFDGVALWSTTGYRNDLGANLWFDELQAH